MASPRGHHRRRSMEEPVNMSSDVINLKEELNRLHKDVFPECNKHMEKMSDLLNELDNGFKPAIFALRGAVITGGIAVVFAVLSFFVYDDDVSLILASAGAAMAVFAVLCLAVGRSRTTQQEKNIKQMIEVELKAFLDKMNRFIDVMERICRRTEEILRDPSLSGHKTQALSEHFAYSFEKRLFQEHESKVDDRMTKIALLSGKLSEMIAKVSSVPDLLKEIIEDRKRQRDQPAKPTREFKEKAEKIIDDMRKGIRDLKKQSKRSQPNSGENVQSFEF
ncbi:uncharacterized protein LOC122349029 [Puntigrus tetrazona]|uniref:uncharacterized protein LOC122349029 n=1 Tax=Puntigrus tetrazona TaxID=1606681 RepID=UPI001C8A9645|nr:uncharacterized protein LOC122349029 [Puntigrus tetrazona]XP_043100888.1 uncharacterized protein LOC122349029 [Puntigrus tetrazona]XP_043100889.1 uncharacterized protein LOC122349029 [Puntigrus tetrazona]